MLLIEPAGSINRSGATHIIDVAVGGSASASRKKFGPPPNDKSYGKRSGVGRGCCGRHKTDFLLSVGLAILKGRTMDVASLLSSQLPPELARGRVQIGEALNSGPIIPRPKVMMSVACHKFLVGSEQVERAPQARLRHSQTADFPGVLSNAGESGNDLAVMSPRDLEWDFDPSRDGHICRHRC